MQQRRIKKLHEEELNLGGQDYFGYEGFSLFVCVILGYDSFLTSPEKCYWI